MKKNIDILYNRKLAGLESPIAANDWGEFEKKLNAQKGSKKKLFVWLSTILIVCISAFWLLNPDTTNQNISQNINPKNNQTNIPKSNNKNLNHKNTTSETLINKQPASTNNIYINPQNNIQNTKPVELQKQEVAISPDKNNIIEAKAEEKTIEPPQEIINPTIPNNIDTLIPKKEKEIKQKNGSPKSKSFWGIAVTAFAGYPINASKASSTNDYTHKDYNTIQNNSANFSNNFSLKVEAKYGGTSGFQFSGGISVKQFAEAVHYHFYKTEIPVIDSAQGNGRIVGYITLPQSQASKIDVDHVNRYTYIQIPVSISYSKKYSKKWGAQISLGGSAGFLASASGETIRKSDLEPEKLTRSNALMGKVSGGFHTGIGVSYYIFANTNIFVNMIYDKQYTSIQNIQSVGVNTGIQFKL